MQLSSENMFLFSLKFHIPGKESSCAVLSETTIYCHCPTLHLRLSARQSLKLSVTANSYLNAYSCPYNVHSNAVSTR